MSDDVSSFDVMFPEPPASRRTAREARAKKERRTQLTNKQRNRGAVRTEQICFRCSPGFKARLHVMRDHMDASIADVLEDALMLLERAKGVAEEPGAAQ